MKNWIFISTVLIFILNACASLQTSEADLQMRYHGSYTCESFSKEPEKKESIAEADASRTRCARDSWKVHGDEVEFTRTLFQQKNCSMELGRVTFTAPAEYVKNGIQVSSPHCHLIRTNVSWLGEESGKCSFSQLQVKHPYSIGEVTNSQKCRRYLPSFCFSTGAGSTLKLTPPSNELNTANRQPVSSLVNQEMVCKRYDPIQ